MSAFTTCARSADEICVTRIKGALGGTLDLDQAGVASKENAII